MQAPKEVDFKEVAAKINKNYAEHERNIKQLCQKTSIIALADFYDDYQREVKEISSEITPSKDRPTISDFADIFKAFEEYPANIQKPKKPIQTKEPRLNSTLLKGSTSSLVNDNATAPKDNSSSSINQSRLEECATATEIYSEFKKFNQKLNQLNAELQKRDLAQDYSVKLGQLSTFAHQLEKLLPVGRVGTPAFSADEEDKLQRLEKELCELNFIQCNQDVFQNVGGAGGSGFNSVARLENLVEVLLYALISISCFNGIQH